MLFPMLQSSAHANGLGKRSSAAAARLCAGVVRAIDVVKIVLDLYVRARLRSQRRYHNRHVVEELRQAERSSSKN